LYWLQIVACTTIQDGFRPCRCKLHFFKYGLDVKQLTSQDYQSLTENAQTIEFDLHGPKVLLLRDGSMLKLFRRKRLLSSAMWYPYAQRFADNCRRLHELEVPCPEVIGVLRIRSVERDAVLYRPLEGMTVRQLIASGLSEKNAELLRKKLRSFIEVIHERGIYFRSLHLGNIVQTPCGAIGLIDVADMSISKRRLGRLARYRNREHVLRCASDAQWLGNDFFNRP
jgi:hypothetical protein